MAKHGATVVIGTFISQHSECRCNFVLTIVIGCRDVNKAEEALKKIRETNPKGSVESMRLDLASLASVREFAAAFKAKYNSLNLLINNAYVLVMCPLHFLKSHIFAVVS